ncbi:MAG: ABC transporter permease [Firmicutes bacterium]|nr:ABC transporter permease [Bacillota bacterium]MBQ5960701.1 ABC transporter permease [Bacillota bacterium]
MAKYLIKRVARSFLTLFIVITIVFSLLRLMPIEGYFSNYDKMSPEKLERELARMGLSDPLPQQLMRFYGDLLHGDLGVSNRYRAGVPITEILRTKFPLSVAFGVASMILSLLLGIPLGAWMARRKNKWPDHLGTVFIVFIEAVPSAVYYLFIQMYGTDIFKISMLFSRDNPRTWILPVISLSLGDIAYYGMWLRRYMVDEMNKDYVRLAVAKGVNSKDLMMKHVFRNAFVPLVQYIPSGLLLTMVGSIYVESLYSIPGMGGLLVSAIQAQDNSLVQALVIIYAAISILGMILGDILMTLVDPRISFVKKEGAR